MKFIKTFLLIMCFFSCRILAGELSLRSFGAKGNGVIDDTEAFKSALLYASENNSVITGEGLTYLITGRLDLNLRYLSLKNCRFITSRNYKDQVTVNITSNHVIFTDIAFDGGRDTYKTEPEEWKDFSSENGTVSIYPATNDLFFFVGLDNSAEYTFNNIVMTNVHAPSCITVITFGEVLLNNLNFRNISNKTFHIYHSTDNGIFQSGSTHAGKITSENVGILPNKILYKNVIVENKNIKVMPQASFNFIVSFGEYYIKDATVKNYGSSGVTSDRNTRFEAELINVSNDSDKAFSNNPSGAVWFEATNNIRVKEININISRRSKRDLSFDSSAFSIYGVNTIAEIETLNIKGIDLNKGIKGSFEGINKITIHKIRIAGNYKQAAGLFAMMPDKKIGSTIKIDEMFYNGGTVEFFGIKEVKILSLQGKTGAEHLNFKLPYSLNGHESYRIGSTNLTNVYKSKVVVNFKALNKMNRQIQPKILQ